MSIRTTHSPAVSPPASAAAAHSLPPQARQQLARDARAGQAITQLAAQPDVSRKFIYQQLRHAHDAWDQAFAPPPDPPDQLRFWLPVTKPWLRQLVLGLVLIGPSSLRGVTALLADLCDDLVALGTVPGLLHQAVARARTCHHQQDLAAVRLGAHDEIFQAGQPVLVGADVASTYCYLLSLEEHRDADTGGVRLLALAARGFAPPATSADFGSGWRAGQQQALPDVPCRGDVCHPLRDCPTLVTALDHRADQALSCRADLERQQARSAWRQGRPSRSVAMKAAAAARAATQAIAWADDVRTLLGWLRQDLLAVAGPDCATRRALDDWVVAELRTREPACPHRLKPVRTLRENHQAALLALAQDLDQQLQALAAELAVAPAVRHEILPATAWPPRHGQRWAREALLWPQRGDRYPAVREAVTQLSGPVVRASSVIENLNSRLRNDFFLRRHLGADSLALVQVFWNHRRFVRRRMPSVRARVPRNCGRGENTGMGWNCWAPNASPSSNRTHRI